MPCQCIKNNLDIDEFPTELQDIRRLERVLISRRILFKKIAIMSKGQSPKLKGQKCQFCFASSKISFFHVLFKYLPKYKNFSYEVL